MKLNEPVYDTIRKTHAVAAVPQLVAEFNHNRYTTTTVENNPTEYDSGHDPDLFPITSVVEPFRPKAGLVKAAVGNAKISLPYVNNTAVRYVVADADDKYKYWLPPFAATGTTITGFEPRVEYTAPVRTNKIVIGFEDSYTSPTEYEVFVQTVPAGPWTSIGNQTNFAIDADGRLNIYYNGSSWHDTVVRSSNIMLSGVQVKVTKVNVSNSRPGVIEISARLESDLTPYLQAVGDTFDAGDTTSLLPVGRASSNIGSVTLFNSPIDQENLDLGLIFNQNNPNSIFEGLTESNVKFTLTYLYDGSSEGGSTGEQISEFVMYAEDNWNAGGMDSVTINVRDISKYLQETKPPQLFIEGETAIKCAYKVLDSIGFRDYNIVIGDNTDIPLIPYFWTTGDDPVWSVLQELSESAQLAFVIDAEGILQIMTRTAIYDPDAAPVWSIRGNQDADELTDLVDYQPETAHRSNAISVIYNTAFLEKNGYGDLLRTEAWTPEEIIVGSSDLSKDLLVADTTVSLVGTDVTTWPFDGIFQMGGEFISYEGKEYGYWDVATPTVKTYKMLKSQDEYVDTINRILPAKRADAGYTGKLGIKERGLFNTVPHDHTVDTLPLYSFLRVTPTSTSFTTEGSYRYKPKGKPSRVVTFNGLKKPSQKGYITLAASYGYASPRLDMLMLRRGSGFDLPPKFYGTRLRFQKDKGITRRAGIHVFGTNTAETGYYIELKPSIKKTTSSRELIIYEKNTDGSYTMVGSSSGYNVAIVEDTWYDLQVAATRSGSNDHITVWINGRKIVTATKSSSLPDYGGRYGLFVRGNSYVDFEYFYAVNGEAFSEDDGDYSFFDMYSGGFVSNPFQKTFIASEGKQSSLKKGKLKKAEGYRLVEWYDEFGPVAHEVMEFDAKFTEDTPVKLPIIVSTNESGIAIIDFKSSPFKAHFYAMNISRDNEPLSGSVNDTDFKTTILGYIVQFKETEKVVVEDQQSISTHGRMEMEAGNKWVQSKQAAESLGDWIKQHWERANSTCTVEIFGNPLIQVGDIVTIEYDLANLDGTQKFFVVSADNAWDSGLTTTLKLRLA